MNNINNSVKASSSFLGSGEDALQLIFKFLDGFLEVLDLAFVGLLL